MDYKYCFHPGLKLEKNDWGKCVIYLMPQELTFYFNVSKIKDFLPRSTDQKYLRELFNGWNFIQLAGVHQEIQILDKTNALIFGGGAYFMFEDKSLFVDRSSSDYGKMNKSLLTKLLTSEGIELKTLDDEFFNLDSLNKILFKRGLPPAESTIRTDISPIDKNCEDIPF